MNVFLKRLNNQNTKEIPVWFMRQAGRYMKEYHLVKNKFDDFITMCKNIDAVTEITLQPINRFEIDAAIIFSDILILLECLGLKVSFVKGKGPIVDNKDFEKVIDEFDYNTKLEELSAVYKSIKEVKKELTRVNKPLIGFAGAPWTIATYILEGKISKDQILIKKYAAEKPRNMAKLMKILSFLVTEHLSNQIDSGVDAIQIFESHSNSMDCYLSELYMINTIKKITKELKERHAKIPIIFFSKTINYIGNKDFFNNINCVSLGSNYRMKDLIKLLPNEICFQGNLDPVKLMVGGSQMIEDTKKIIEDMKGKNFIFNLGHGILQHTPVKNLEILIEEIKKSKRN